MQHGPLYAIYNMIFNHIQYNHLFVVLWFAVFAACEIINNSIRLSKEHLVVSIHPLKACLSLYS